MPDPTPSSAEKIAAARIMLSDALGYLEARGVTVELHAEDGVWQYVADGKSTTTGGLVALALLIAPPTTVRLQ